MFEKLEIFRMAQAMARHAGTRQAVVAQNIANADTPGYAARDVAPFTEIMKQDGTGPGGALRATRPGHLDRSETASAAVVIERRGAQTDPNGNSVSLETEMLYAVDVKRQHDRAIAIYKSSLSILRAAIGRR